MHIEMYILPIEQEYFQEACTEILGTWIVLMDLLDLSTHKNIVTRTSVPSQNI